MFLKNLILNDFRNYNYQCINFVNGLNFIVGNNAQGKTNILEAIYISSIGKSFRTSKDLELICFGKSEYSIEVNVEKFDREVNLLIGYNSKIGKIVRVNGVKKSKYADLIGNLVLVVFTPDDMKLVKDSPIYRRKYLDMLISQINKSYFCNLQEYNKILEQRNALLKRLKFFYNKKDIEFLDVLDEQITNVGSKVINKRLLYVDKIVEKIENIHEKLTENKEKISLEYENSFLCGNINRDFDTVLLKYREQILKKRDLDIQRGYTSIGPNRDDLSIFINGVDVGKFGSQGQQRTVVLSLKLSELEIIKDEIGDSPVLLLDDVFSELDLKRKSFLKEYIKDIQVFITTADKNEIDNAQGNVIFIKEGNVV